MQYRNTPIKYLGLSPAQLLFHRSLRDCLPTDPRALRPSRLWIKAASRREEAFYKRNLEMSQRYDSTARSLSPIPVGTRVLIQECYGKKRWCKSGVVVEFNNRKYFIKMDGSGRVLSRNRRFIRPVMGDDNEPVDAAIFNPSMPTLSRQAPGVIPSCPNEIAQLPNDNNQTVASDNELPVGESNSTNRIKVPRMVRELMDHNKPGLLESQTPIRRRLLRSTITH